MELWCFKCQEGIQVEGTKGLAFHLRQFHAIESSGEMLICGQDGCMQTFSLLNSFLRHIKLQHIGVEKRIEEDEEDSNQQNEQMDHDNHEESSDDEVGPHVVPAEHLYLDNFDHDTLKQLALSLLMKLRSTASVPYSSVQEVMNRTREMFGSTLSALEHEMLRVMQAHGVNTDANDVRDLCYKFSTYQNPFSGIETLKQQSEYMVEKLLLVKPHEIPLGVRFDQAVCRKTGQILQKAVTDTFQYVHILDVLRMVLSPAIQRTIAAETMSPAGYIQGYQDGQQFQQLGFLRDHPLALRFQLYYDDVEVVNPLGSKTGVHKLGLFYYSIQNLPRCLNSSMNSVHLLAVCHSSDLKKFGFTPILRPFIEEMRQLESDDGAVLELRGEEVLIHGTLVSFSADSAAAHELLGFMSPSANKLCRLCDATREQIQHDFLESNFDMRDVEDHDACAEVAEARRQGDPLSGIRTSCSLNNLRSFHCVTNFNLDIMHDLLEGVCPYEVKLLLHTFTRTERLITCDELNQRIKAFHYSSNDRKNKPSAILPDRIRNLVDHKIGQKAAQMWCLVRMLPLLIGDRIPVGNKHFDLLLLLLRCMDIIYAPVTTHAQTAYLKYLILDHHQLFKQLYPQYRMINKHHHMIHYPTCIQMAGPLTTMQCLKYEMKHGFCKRVASVNCNFKNISKSVACKHQILQCAALANGEVRTAFECKAGSLVVVQSLEGGETAAESLGLNLDEEIFIATHVVLYGTDYKTNMYLVTDVNGGEPQFGKICSIIVAQPSVDSVHFLVKLCSNNGFNTHYHGYRVALPQDPMFTMKGLSSLVDHLPLTGLRSYEQASPVYLCPRYSILKTE